jgi:hypothetical protein
MSLSKIPNSCSVHSEIAYSKTSTSETVKYILAASIQATFPIQILKIAALA